MGATLGKNKKLYELLKQKEELEQLLQVQLNTIEFYKGRVAYFKKRIADLIEIIEEMRGVKQ